MPEAVKRDKLPRNSIQHPTTLKPSQLESDGAAYPVGGVGWGWTMKGGPQIVV